MQTTFDTVRRAGAILLATVVLAACGAQASPTPGGSAAGGTPGNGGGPGGSGAPGDSGLNPGGASGGAQGGTGGTGGGGPSAALGQLEAAYEAVVQKVSPSVVVIETSEGLGSGIVFDTNGNIVTNAHVVGEAGEFRVTLSDGSQLPATLVGTYPANDVAVIKVNPADAARPRTSPAPSDQVGSGSSLPPLPSGAAPESPSAGGTPGGTPGESPAATVGESPAATSGSTTPGFSATPGGSGAPTTTAAGLVPATFADSGRLRVGQIVLAVGNPLGLQSSVTNGIISSLARTVAEPGGAVLANMIQTSAAINPGNSGGALVDINGNVIGIPTLAAADPQIGSAAPGIGFAIPANDAKDYANQLIATGRVTNTHRAYLGIRSADVNVDAVLVYAVVEGGPAAQSGIRAGDLIVSIDGKPTPSAADLSAILAQLQPGQTVAVGIVRQNGEQTSVRVTLAQLPG